MATPLIGEVQKPMMRSCVATTSKKHKLITMWKLPLEGSGVKPKGTKYKCSEPNVEARPK